jgi:hypothetical protein
MQCKNVQFPAVRSVYLRFDTRCWDRDDDNFTAEWAESQEFRSNVLKNVFKMLCLPHNRDIRSLTIMNLQNINDQEVVTGGAFQEVIARLTTLRLLICTEQDDAALEHSIQKRALHQFTRELPSVWLQPTSARLTCLSLYMDTYFGWAPKLDLRGLNFPVLRCLELGNFVFAHDWQLDWIVGHAKTLQTLALDSCAILFRAMSDWPLDSEGFPVSGEFVATEPEHYQYASRWHNYFDRFREELTELRNFSFGASDWAGENQLDHPITMPQELYYVAFDGQWTEEILSSQQDADWEAEMQPAFDEVDKAALVNLLKNLGQSLPKSFVE